jgi:uncharacterized protein YyaL (SSP411 family)
MKAKARPPVNRLSLVLLSWLALTPGLLLAQPLSNQMAQQPSAYLQLHAKDPVLWQPLNADTLALAQKTNKPLFLSIGYFACHWCHVAQAELYQNPQIADWVNAHYIPIKLDRETDLSADSALQEFSRWSGQPSGWPLHSLMTPEAAPLNQFGYQPAEEFLRHLKAFSQEWEQNAPALNRLAQAALQSYQTIQPSPQDLHTDELLGGYGQTAKFPFTPGLIDALQRPALLEEERDFLKLTLDAMQDGELHDRLWGGFFRYTTQSDWTVPHFEKMLADQALLIQAYLLASQVYENPAYLTLSDETLAFVFNEMGLAEGLYSGSLSALDPQGQDGGSYLFETNQLNQAQAQGGDPLPDGRRLLAKASPTSIEQLRQRKALSKPPKDPNPQWGWNGLLLASLADRLAHPIASPTHWMNKAKRLDAQLSIALQNTRLSKIDRLSILYGQMIWASHFAPDQLQTRQQAFRHTDAQSPQQTFAFMRYQPTYTARLHLPDADWLRKQLDLRGLK